MFSSPAIRMVYTRKTVSVRNSDGGRETRIHVSSPAICMVYTLKTVSVRNSDGGRGT